MAARDANGLHKFLKADDSPFEAVILHCRASQVARLIKQMYRIPELAGIAGRLCLSIRRNAACQEEPLETYHRLLVRACDRIDLALGDFYKD